MPIEVTYNPHVIYVHVLHNDDPERTRRLVARLESLSVAVLGGPEALAAVEHPLPWPPPPPEEKPTWSRRPSRSRWSTTSRAQRSTTAPRPTPARSARSDHRRPHPARPRRALLRLPPPAGSPAPPPHGRA